MLDQLIADLHSRGVEAEPIGKRTVSAVGNENRIAISLFERSRLIWTMGPAAYEIPAHQKVEDVCSEVLFSATFDQFHIPTELLEKFSLRRLSQQEYTNFNTEDM